MLTADRRPSMNKGDKHEEETGVITFNGTDATGELPLQRITQLEHVSFTAIETAPATGEECWVNEVWKGNYCKVDRSTGCVTVARTGSPTSGQKYTYRARGL